VESTARQDGTKEESKVTIVLSVLKTPGNGVGDSLMLIRSCRMDRRRKYAHGVREED